MLSPRFSPSSRAALARARTLVHKHRSEFVGTAHLLLALLEERQFQGDNEPEIDRVGSLLLSSGVSRTEAQLYAQSAPATDEGDATTEDLYSPALERVLSWAQTHTYAEIIEPEHLLIALMHPQNGPHVGAVMQSLGLQVAQLELHLRQLERDEAPAGKPLRMLDRRAKAALHAAHQAMRASYCGRVSTLHLLLGLLETRAPIGVFLEKQGVNLDELRDVAVRAGGTDGEIGGPQLQLAPVAKRAIERAKKLALKSPRGNPQPRIAPEHLWLALLPRAATTREKLRWGGELADPLDAVWKRFDSEPLECALRLYLSDSTLSVPLWSQLLKPPQPAPEKINKIHLNWPWVFTGVTYHLVWVFFGLETGGVLLAIATVWGLALTITGSLTRSRPMRDGAASWLCGLIAGIFVTWFVGANLDIK